MATIFGFLYMGAHCRHLKNTTEPSMCGGDAALCQITLTTCSCKLQAEFMLVEHMVKYAIPGEWMASTYLVGCSQNSGLGGVHPVCT